MEITGLSSFYLDTLSETARQSSPTTERFDEILRKTDESETSVRVLPANVNTPIDKTDQLYQLCLELETFLVKNLISGMRNTVQKSGLIDDGFAGKIYEDMLYDEYAKEFTKSANFGLAEQAYRQLRMYQ